MIFHYNAAHYITLHYNSFTVIKSTQGRTGGKPALRDRPGSSREEFLFFILFLSNRKMARLIKELVRHVGIATLQR